ncbi:hypothetical protein V6N13_015027 [Hibiscus sabdariffa]
MGRFQKKSTSGSKKSTLTSAKVNADVSRSTVNGGGQRSTGQISPVNIQDSRFLQLNEERVFESEVVYWIEKLDASRSSRVREKDLVKVNGSGSGQGQNGPVRTDGSVRFKPGLSLVRFTGLVQASRMSPQQPKTSGPMDRLPSALQAWSTQPTPGPSPRFSPPPGSPLAPLGLPSPTRTAAAEDSIDGFTTTALTAAPRRQLNTTTPKRSQNNSNTHPKQ